MEFWIFIEKEGTAMKYNDILPFLTEITNQINDCMANGGTHYSIAVSADASCFREDKA